MWMNAFSTGWTLNCGSGKLFKDSCVNIDINPLWQPDVLADLTQPFPPGPGHVYRTARFGDVTFEPGSVSRIIAHDLLEHLPQLPVFYASCLHLLQEGGTLDIVTPYDLSLGAWQDPTHVRAFNENSWLYLTDWYWYLGWTAARFELESLAYRYSPLGESLLATGEEAASVRRKPRAVDAMEVLLRKRSCSAKEREKAEARLARYGVRPPGFHMAE